MVTNFVTERQLAALLVSLLSCVIAYIPAIIQLSYGICYAIDRVMVKHSETVAGLVYETENNLLKVLYKGIALSSSYFPCDTSKTIEQMEGFVQVYAELLEAAYRDDWSAVDYDAMDTLKLQMKQAYKPLSA